MKKKKFNLKQTTGKIGKGIVKVQKNVKAFEKKAKKSHVTKMANRYVNSINDVLGNGIEGL